MALFAVDEGILQVARYRLKDPLEFFFSKRELNVSSSQILDLILPEFSKLMALTAAPGGDAGEGLDLNLNPFKRKRDKPVAYWSGIFETDGGPGSIDYRVPDYFSGTIRVLAAAMQQACATPEVKQRLASAGGEEAFLGTADFTTFLAKDARNWAEVVKVIAK